MRRWRFHSKLLWIGVELILGSLLAAGYLVAAYGSPYICNDGANTCTYRITVIEPSTKASGAALDNYKQSNIKRQVNAGAFVTDVLLATNPAGGGTVFEDVSFPTVACTITTFTVKVSGTNLANLEGADSALVSVARDREADPSCIPPPPTGVGVE